MTDLLAKKTMLEASLLAVVLIMAALAVRRERTR
jgi:hypothetical protein